MAKRTSRATPGRDTSGSKSKPAGDSGKRLRSTSPGGVKVLAAANLSGVEWLVHGFSTRQGGVSPAYGGRALNLGPTHEDSPENVDHNRKLFINKLGALDADAVRGLSSPSGRFIQPSFIAFTNRLYGRQAATA